MPGRPTWHAPSRLRPPRRRRGGASRRANAAAACGRSPPSCSSTPTSWPCWTPSTSATRSATCAGGSRWPPTRSRCSPTGPGPAGRDIPASAEHLHITTRRPYGVVARIVAFNRPIMFAASKIAVLVAGNTVVLKPSDLAPLSALRLGALLRTRWHPACSTWSLARAQPAVARSSATPRSGGSPSPAAPPPGARSSVTPPTTPSAVSLELGGQTPIVVCADADLDRAADAVPNGMNFTGVQGQSCGSTSRLIVQAPARDALLERLLQRISAIHIGSPLDPATQMGTLASRPQYDRASASSTRPAGTAPRCWPAEGAPRSFRVPDCSSPPPCSSASLRT